MLFLYGCGFSGVRITSRERGTPLVYLLPFSPTYLVKKKIKNDERGTSRKENRRRRRGGQNNLTQDQETRNLDNFSRRRRLWSSASEMQLFDPLTFIRKTVNSMEFKNDEIHTRYLTGRHRCEALRTFFTPTRPE